MTASDGQPEPPPSADDRAAFLADVLHGLTRTPKSIPGKYLWDRTGSELFDRICDSRDYYPTGRETALLRREAAEIARLVGPDVSLVEFGSGASHKIRILLDAFDRPQCYVAIEISEAFLAVAAGRIARDYPELAVIPVVGDYTRPLSLPPLPGGPVLGFFPGTAVGNFDRRDVVAFLSRARTALGPGWFLVGIDPNRDAATLSRAYSGPDGLMAAFHGNLLVRIARELGGTLDPGNFRFEARVLPDPPHVEAHLVALSAAEYRLGGQPIRFEAGESIHTDSSHKYDPDSFRAVVGEAGWEPVRCWVDADGLFSLHLLRDPGVPAAGQAGRDTRR